ncbi:class I SAM-dependent methyltransferase [Rhodobacter sp. NSM]|uniref:class I SAM-dependent methyltransferase n=1 Tax=Rhodobacter sp. NSM TaxID=3457501 RepID=UPI003FCF6CB4
MINKLRTAWRHFKHMYRLPDRFERFELIVNTAHMSPVDRHVTMHLATSHHAVYAISYAHWRTKRINKILELYGPEWFLGKRVLELGSGLSDIGAFFADLGASVLCLEGRNDTAQIARLKHRNVCNFNVEVFDLEEDFTTFGKFDMIIHFGLLYHIPDVEKHLARCFSMANEVVLETVVCDSSDPMRIELVQERKDVIEEAMHGTGSRPSAAFVERIAKENGFRPQMVTTSDLNVGNQFVYDWISRDDGDLGGWRKRRFWKISAS